MLRTVKCRCVVGWAVLDVSNGPAILRLLRGLLDPEDDGTRFVRNVENRSPNETASHQRRPESAPESSVKLERHGSRNGWRMWFVLVT